MAISQDKKGSKTQEPAALAEEANAGELNSISPAKAGKRSAKALAQTQETLAKQERKKAHAQEKLPEKTHNPNPPRSRLERAGKKYRQAAKKIDDAKSYSLDEAVKLAIGSAPAVFDETLEIHLNLNVDPKQADQNIRGSVVLPAGTGKSLRVAVLADEEEAQKAQSAGADLTDRGQILQELEKELVNFDVLIATPAAMPQLGKFAKLLGPKGLMPSPKSGTVTTNAAQAVTEAKAGKIEFRVDSYGIVHLPIGKKSFGADKLSANAEAVITQVKSTRPASVKGLFITSATLCTTMGPPIKVQT